MMEELILKEHTQKGMNIKVEFGQIAKVRWPEKNAGRGWGELTFRLKQS